MPRYLGSQENGLIMQYNYIAIEGTIGAGKTTLASRIARDFNGKLVLEEFEGEVT